MIGSRNIPGKVVVRGILVTTLSCLFLISVSGQQPNDKPLTNAAVIKLVKAGFKEKTIIAIINSRPNQFTLDTEQLIQLKQNGVNENIILAMLSLSGSFTSEDDFGDEAFFRESTRQAASSQGTDTNIFGSSGGSKSRNKTDGNRGGGQNDSNVTGSATVRIIRPPSEAGAPPKLEKTPTLNNDAVIRLVEAGFSEGTIIKRIESSPVDFDLSPTKVEELQKRRVTEPIISAMTSAMNDGEAKPLK
jgi:hypothetical protein